MTIKLTKAQLKHSLPDDIITALSAHILTENVDRIVTIVLAELLGKGGGLWIM